MKAYRGKIGRLPLAIRDEICRRLQNGQLGPQILPWLNGLPEVNELLKSEFEGLPVNPANLSDWRRGGFKEWINHHDRLLRTKALAEKAAQLAREAGGDLTEGAAAIIAGHILETLESAKDTMSADEIGAMVKPLVALRSGDQQTARLRQLERDLSRKQEELQLAREKFMRDTAETVLKSARDEAVQKIANAPTDHGQQLSEIGKHLFGDLWK